MLGCAYAAVPAQDRRRGPKTHGKRRACAVAVGKDEQIGTCGNRRRQRRKNRLVSKRIDGQLRSGEGNRRLRSCRAEVCSENGQLSTVWNRGEHANGSGCLINGLTKKERREQ